MGRLLSYLIFNFFSKCWFNLFFILKPITCMISVWMCGGSGKHQTVYTTCTYFWRSFNSIDAERDTIKVRGKDTLISAGLVVSSLINCILCDNLVATLVSV